MTIRLAPQVVGDRVVTASGTGKIHPLDKKTGRPVWSHDLYAEFGGTHSSSVTDPIWDAAEAEALYEVLEREVIPEFYTRDEQGIPTAWVARLTLRFSADRTVREYAEQHYLPGAVTYRERAADKGAVGRQVVDWQHAMEKEWPAMRFGEMKVETNGEQHVFEVQAYLNDLDPNAMRVELYADGVNGDGPVRQEMKPNYWAGPAATSIAYRCPRHARLPTIRCE